MTHIDLLAELESPEQRLIRLHPDSFAPDFLDWFADNVNIWARFNAEAIAVWNAGRKHYSARTIGEFIRHETTLREAGEYKCNDHRWPDLSRLWLLKHPECAGFFETRVQRDSSRRAA